VELRVLNVANASEIDTAFATTLAREPSVPVVVSGEPLFMSQRVQLVVLAARHAIPAIYGYREFAAAGGLMSYGLNVADDYRQIGTYAGRILKGAKPSDLPVQQVVKVELVINLRTATALRLSVTPSLLARRRRGHRVTPKHPPGPPMTLGNMRLISVWRPLLLVAIRARRIRRIALRKPSRLTTRQDRCGNQD
jgi:hypothetical protein